MVVDDQAKKVESTIIAVGEWGSGGKRDLPPDSIMICIPESKVSGGFTRH